MYKGFKKNARSTQKAVKITFSIYISYPELLKNIHIHYQSLFCIWSNAHLIYTVVECYEFQRWFCCLLKNNLMIGENMLTVTNKKSRVQITQAFYNYLHLSFSIFRDYLSGSVTRDWIQAELLPMWSANAILFP